MKSPATKTSAHARTDAPAQFSLPESSDAMREFHFSDADFRGLVELAYQFAGIALSDSKRNLVYSRLSRRLRVLGMTTFADTAPTSRPPRASAKISSTRSRRT